MILRTLVLATFASSLAFAQGERKSASGPLTVGVVAAINDQKAADQATALAMWVKSTTGRDAREKVFTDYEKAAAAVGAGEVDIAIMGPLAYLRIDPKAKSRALVRMMRKGQSTYRAVIFAKPGSPLKDLVALKKAKNLKVGWVDPSSATGYIIPKALLLQNNIDPAQTFVTQDFAGSHDAVCKGVFEGKWDVGATFDDGAANTAPRALGCQTALGNRSDKLTVVTATAQISNDVLVVTGGFPKDQADRIVAEAKKLASSEAGKKTLAGAFAAEGVDDVVDADFEPVRKALDAFKK